MRRMTLSAAVPAALIALAGPAAAEPLAWNFNAEQFEFRTGDEDLLAWSADFTAGYDDLKVLIRSEAEYGLEESAFEKLETQARLATPIADFWDATAGIMVSTPEGPDRVYGVVGFHGLAPQWFEVDADAYLSDKPFLRAEVDYEALITNRVILTPSIEATLPLVDDAGIDRGGFAPIVEVGARLSYDLVDRLVSPYVGVHYERAFGESGDRRRASGGARDALFFVAGTKILF
ncbi:copper resistance protein B [Albimonas pacifica]|uniref:Copper resistance protein B n=1 Tax=Albimonas pacifica TaxID=1114924 RepID=A0A1I3GQ91_9RHOB|nr:copper resistance protein B [Albimonas pacifica]SFI25554.1 copper resistance protein B [Albimonas pacifica]